MKEEQGIVFPSPIPYLPSHPDSGEIFVRAEGQADFVSTMSINRGSRGSFAAKGPPVPLPMSTNHLHSLSGFLYLFSSPLCLSGLQSSPPSSPPPLHSLGLRALSTSPLHVSLQTPRSLLLNSRFSIQ